MPKSPFYGLYKPSPNGILVYGTGLPSFLLDLNIFLSVDVSFNSPQFSEAFPQMKHEQVEGSFGAAVHPAISVTASDGFTRPGI
jgi:hypothetical protein